MDYYDIRAVSNSSLTWFEESPLYFKQVYDKVITPEDKKHFRFGRMMHTYILEKELFEEQFKVIDYSTPTSANQIKMAEAMAQGMNYVDAYKASYSIKDKSEKKIAEESEKLYTELKPYVESLSLVDKYHLIQRNDFAFLEDAEVALRNNEQSHRLFYKDAEAYNENAIEFDFRGIKCKCKIDRYIVGGKSIDLIDLKTAKSFQSFEENFSEYNYDREAAFYTMGLYSKYKTRDINVYFAVLTKRQPVECRVYKIREATLSKGLDKIEKAFDELTFHFKEDKWDYPQKYYNEQYQLL